MAELIVIEGALSLPEYEPDPTPYQPSNCHPLPGVADIETDAVALYHPEGVTSPHPAAEG